MSKVQDLTEETFKSDVLEGSGPALVEFWGSWCSSCKAMFPVLDELSEAQDKLKITKLSVEDAPEVARSYGVTSIPAMLVFENGVVVQTIVGAKTYEKLSEELKDFI